MIRHLLLAVLLLATVTGCATGPQVRPVENRVTVPDTLPEKLQGEGLLVATIAANAVARTKFEQFSFSIAGIQIDNTLYAKAIRANYLVLPLKPGEYTMDSLHVYGKAEDRTTTRYPLHFKFRIVEGQATNLGTIVLVKDTRPEAPATRYRKALIDNTAEMAAYLRKHHPRLAASLAPQQPALAANLHYVDNPAQLETVRREIARFAWFWMDNLNTTNFSGGEAGTLAKLLRDTRGKVAAIDVLDSKTTVPMRSCSGHDNRFVCSSAEPALYHVNDTVIERRELPMTATHVWVHTYPPRGLVLVDQNLTVYMSNDNGTTWKKQVWYGHKNPLTHLANVRFSNGKNGYYLYTTWSFDPLVSEVMYSDYSSRSLQPVEIPRMKSWDRLLETSQGLLVGAQDSDTKGEPSRLYFRAHGKSDWQARPLPGQKCGNLQYANNVDEKLMIFCDGKFFVSADGGVRWTEQTTEKK